MRHDPPKMVLFLEPTMYALLKAILIYIYIYIYMYIYICVCVKGSFKKSKASLRKKSITTFLSWQPTASYKTIKI